MSAPHRTSASPSSTDPGARLSGPDPERQAGRAIPWSGHVVHDRPVRAALLPWCSPRWRASRTRRSARCAGGSPRARVRQRDGDGDTGRAGNAKTDRMITFAPDEHPRSLQLYGSDPEIMGRPVAKLCDAGRVDHIDINFGCPAAKVTRAAAERRAGPAGAAAGDPASGGVQRVALRGAGDRQVPHGAVRRLADAHPHRRGVRRGGRGSDRAARSHRSAALLGGRSVGGDRRTQAGGRVDPGARQRRHLGGVRRCADDGRDRL